MKKISLLLPLYLMATGFVLQVNGQKTTAQPDTLFNPVQAFSTIYQSGGNGVRTVSGRPGPHYWQNRSDYRIRAVFDTISRILKAEEEITYYNNSPETLPFLWISLFQNRFRKDSKSAALTPLNGSRFGIAENTDGYDLQAVQWQAVSDTKPLHGLKKPGNSRQATVSMEYQVEGTYMKVVPPVAVQPGERCRIIIRYAFKLPVNGSDLMGVLPAAGGSVFEFCLWYPQVLVYDDLKGWNVSDYGFYSDPGNMDYSITLPAGMTVGGSGQLQNPSEVMSAGQLQRYQRAMNSDTTVMIRTAKDCGDELKYPRKSLATWHFSGEHISSANWAASASFIWDGARMKLPGHREAMAMSLYPAAFNNDGWVHCTENVKKEVEFYSRQWYPYPFAAAVNIGGLVQGLAGAGISFVAAGAGIGMNGVAAITNHEMGHTWFPYIVGGNGLYLWMVEGFNSFINDMNGDSVHCQTAFDHVVATTDWLSSKAVFVPLTTPYSLIRSEAMAMPGYVKPTIALRILRNDVLGAARFDAAFRGFIRDWAFRHPGQEDFFRYMEYATGEDLSWYWRSWFQNDWKLDQEIAQVKYVKDDPSKGIDITIRNQRKMAMPVVAEIRQSNGMIDRVKLPVQIWLHGDQWVFHYPSVTPVAVLIDPDQHFPDQDRSNNQWEGTDQRKPLPAGFTAQHVVERYLTVIGGRESLNRLQQVAWVLNDSMGEEGFYCTRSYTYPGSFREETGVHSSAFVFQSVWIQDSLIRGWTNGTEMAADHAKKERLRYASLLFPEMEWDLPGYSLSIDDSTLQVNGADVCKISVTNRAGDQWVCFYDMVTGLKVRESREGGWTEGIPSCKIDYLNYLPEQGILLPRTIIYSDGGGDRILRTAELKLRTR